MPRFRASQTVASVVADAPGTSRLFERLGIDFCCGGHVPLSEAVARKGLQVEAVLLGLAQAAAERPGLPAEDAWPTASSLIDHVLEVHHSFVAREIPRLSALMEKVNRVHGPSHSEQIPLMARIWARVAAELDAHMRKEEEILFPAIRAIEARRTPVMPCGVEGPMAVMEAEHEEAGRALRQLRALAKDYEVPADACGSWRALWSGLDEFERDLHVHVHLENALLFPRVREMGVPA
jgi:regulator of cell morphogenesis and NO signaling